MDLIEWLMTIVGALIIGFAVFTVTCVAVSMQYHDYDYFPDCDEKAPSHLEMRILENDDAKDVASRARADGWDNVHVNNGVFFWATVSGDCSQSLVES